MSGQQFTLNPADNPGFYVTIGEEITVYEKYADAVTEIQEKVATETDSFLAEVVIESTDDEDVAVTLEQVSWQQVIQDMATGVEGEES